MIIKGHDLRVYIDDVPVDPTQVSISQEIMDVTAISDQWRQLVLTGFTEVTLSFRLPSATDPWAFEK